MSVESAVQQYRDKGVVSLKGFFSPETASKLAAIGEEIAAAAGAGALSRNSQFTAGFDLDRFNFLREDPELLQLAVKILGPNVKFYFWRLLMKDHNFTEAVAAHQDWPYFSGNTEKLNLFIPLSICNDQNGMLVFYERSHLLGPLTQGHIAMERYPDLTAVTPELKPGDILATHILAWHASVPSVVLEPRVLLQMVLAQGQDACTRDVLAGSDTASHLVLSPTEPMERPQPSIYVGHARWYAGKGDLAHAERILNGILAHEPRNVEAAFALADIDIAKGGNGSPALATATRLLEELQADLIARTSSRASEAVLQKPTLADGTIASRRKPWLRAFGIKTN